MPHFSDVQLTCRWQSRCSRLRVLASCSDISSRLADSELFLCSPASRRAFAPHRFAQAVRRRVARIESDGMPGPASESTLGNQGTAGDQGRLRDSSDYRDKIAVLSSAQHALVHTAGRNIIRRTVSSRPGAKYCQAAAEPPEDEGCWPARLQMHRQTQCRVVGVVSECLVCTAVARTRLQGLAGAGGRLGHGPCCATWKLLVRADSSVGA